MKLALVSLLYPYLSRPIEVSAGSLPARLSFSLLCLSRSLARMRARSLSPLSRSLASARSPPSLLYPYLSRPIEVSVGSLAARLSFSLLSPSHIPGPEHRLICGLAICSTQGGRFIWRPTIFNNARRCLRTHSRVFFYYLLLISVVWFPKRVLIRGLQLQK